MCIRDRHYGLSSSLLYTAGVHYGLSSSLLCTAGVHYGLLSSLLRTAGAHYGLSSSLLCTAGVHYPCGYLGLIGLWVTFLPEVFVAVRFELWCRSLMTS